MNIKQRKAFTLVELLIVIAVVSILFVVLISKVDFATNKAKTTGIQVDFKSFQYAFDTIAQKHSGFNTFGWDTGDINANRQRDSYDEGDTNKDGIQNGGEVWTGHKVLGETWTGVYTLVKPGTTFADVGYDADAISNLENAINACLDMKLQIDIHTDGTITMMNGAQDPWNNEYRGYYITNAEIDGKDRGAIIMYSNGMNGKFGSAHNIAGGILAISIPGNNTMGKDDYAIASIYTCVNNRGEVQNVSTGFSQNQEMFIGDNSTEVEQPDTPDTPDDPDIPVEPDVPDEPDNPEEPVEPEPTVHTCESECLICRKCTDEICNEEACVSKCDCDDNQGSQGGGNQGGNQGDEPQEPEVVLVGGLYDSNGMQLATWGVLTDVYGLDVTKNYTSSTYLTDPASLYSVLTNNPSLSAGTKLVIGHEQSTYSLRSTGVTTIGAYALAGCDGLVDVVIPNTVTSIGKSIFEGCNNLTTLSVPFIGNSAVSNTTKLYSSDYNYKTLGYWFGGFSGNSNDYNKNVNVVPESLITVIITGDQAVAPYAFYGCKNITNIVLSDAITGIRQYAFYGCSALKDFTMSDAVTIIEQYAFYYCQNLTNIVMPDSITTINSSTFYDCRALSEINIPASVTSIGYRAFYNCPALQTVHITDLDKWMHISFYDEYAVPTRHATQLLLNNEQIVGDIVWPDDVTKVPYYIFKSCSGITSITIPNTVTSINKSAFKGCTGLTTLSIPFIGNSAVSNTTKLYSSDYDYKTLGYWFGGFSGNSNDYNKNANVVPESLKTVIITGDQAVAPYAFYGCKNITNIVLSDTITGIREYAFHGCSALKDFTMSDAVTIVEQYAFYYCQNLTNIVIPDGITTINTYTFYDCRALSEINIPASVTSIGYRAFYNCPALQTVHITDLDKWMHISFYDEYAVPTRHATQLLLNNEQIVGDIVWPDDVTKVPYYIFKSCSGITSITIPNTITSINKGAFEGCIGLTTLSVPFIGNSAVSNTTKLYSSDYSYKTLGYWFGGFSGNDSDYRKNANVVPESLKTVIITGDQAVAPYAFYECKNITSIVLSDTITGIRQHAFYSCSALTDFTMSDAVTIIEQYAFYYCQNLTNIVIPDGITTINTYTFYDCRALSEINIPASVTSIGYRAFYNCPALQTVHITDLDKWMHISFYDEYAVPTRHATQLLLNNEQIVGDIVWPDDVTKVPYYIFKSCSGITSITIPNTVTSINKSAFKGCTGLTTLSIPFIGNSAVSNTTKLYSSDYDYKTLGYWFGGFSGNSNDYNKNANVVPESLKTVIITGDQAVAPYAFYGCKNITNIVLSDTITGIRQHAFYGCSALTDFTMSDAVTIIEQSAFYYCQNLTNIVIPDGITTINSSTFYDCKALQTIVLPETVASIGSNAFYQCLALSEINIPASVTSIGYRAFYNCPALQTVHITDLDKWMHISFYDEYAVPTRHATQLLLNNEQIVGDIVWPDDVTKVPYYIFKSCSGITSITIPNTVISINKGAFEGCTGLTTLSVPFIGMQAIDNNASVNISTDSYFYGLGYFFGRTYATSHYASVPESLKTVIVTGDQSIAPYAFYGCKNITNIVLNEGITGIRQHAFYNCTGITELIVPSTVTLIENYAFAYIKIETIVFNGTMEQWNSISKQTNWNNNSSITQIICTDGTITLN